MTVKLSENFDESSVTAMHYRKVRYRLQHPTGYILAFEKVVSEV
jgi:hypothetical protein